MSNQLSGKNLIGYVPLATAASATSVIALALSFAFIQVDAAISERLKVLFGMSLLPEIAVASNILSMLINAGAVFLFSTVACLAGNLAPVPRLICCLQLFVISLLVQWAILATNFCPRPIAFFVAVVFGCASGYLLRVRRLTESRSQSSKSELTLRKRELQEARLQMVKQDETDRRLLAADLHDQVLNDLKILNQQIRAYREQPGEIEAVAIDQLVQQTMNDVRDVMDNLSPAALEHLGFGAALEDCLRRASERSGGFKVRYKNTFGEIGFSELSLIEQTLLYRLVQECGTNICKHAQATVVKILLERVENDLLIRVTDNGTGMPQNIELSASRGVQYMRQRGDLIGATISWMPGEQNKGTTVEIRILVARRS